MADMCNWKRFCQFVYFKGSKLLKIPFLGLPIKGYWNWDMLQYCVLQYNVRLLRKSSDSRLPSQRICYDISRFQWISYHNKHLIITVAFQQISNKFHWSVTHKMLSLPCEFYWSVIKNKEARSYLFTLTTTYFTRLKIFLKWITILWVWEISWF